MQTITFEEALEQLLAKDQRYPRDAYLFVKEALDHTRKIIDREEKKAGPDRQQGPPAEKHVTGQQLLSGIRELALESFGPMAVTVFEEWNIRSCENFGEIVFIMVEHKVLKKTENDSPADFQHGYDFFEAFRKPFLPMGKSAALVEPPKEAKA